MTDQIIQAIELHEYHIAESKAELEKTTSKQFIDYHEALIKLYELSIDALRKQIPVKPAIYDGNTYDDIPIEGVFWSCPVCDKILICEEYCNECGQHIDWGREDD